MDKAIAKYQATGEIDASVTHALAKMDPRDVIGAVFHAAGGGVRLAAIARASDKVFTDKVFPEFAKTATRHKAIQQRHIVITQGNADDFSDAELLSMEEGGFLLEHSPVTTLFSPLAEQGAAVCLCGKRCPTPGF